MSDDLKLYLRQWLIKAEHDIISAQVLLNHQPMVLDVACFHCQQAVEKYLKAFLISRGKSIQKTHDVDKLLVECIELDEDFNSFDLKNLELFAVEARYPDNFLIPELPEAKEYLSIAEEVKKLVEQKIK